MKKVMSTTAVVLALAAVGWASDVRAQLADGCVLNAERFAALDRDGDGSLDDQEYMACADASAVDARQGLRDQFATIDRDRDMKLSSTEAEQFLAEAPQDADAPATDAPGAVLPQEDELPAAAQEAGKEAAPSQTAQDSPVPQTLPAPMGQTEVTRGPLALTPGAQRSPEGASQSSPPAASSGGGELAAVQPPPRTQADPAQWQPLIGAKITNLAGEGLGEFSRLVVNQNREYGAVIESGGFLGFGANQYVVPLQQLQVQDDRLVLNMPKQDLKQLPKFDEAEWSEAAK